MAEKDSRSSAQRVLLRPFDSLFDPTVPEKKEGNLEELGEAAAPESEADT